MKNNILVITAVVVLAVSGFAFFKIMGIGGICCSTHQTHGH